MGPQHTTGSSSNPLRRVSLADCLTLANGVCGLVVVVVALRWPGGAHSSGLSHGRLILCAALIATGTIFDVADGAVAHVRGSSGMGDALDTMSDILTFAAAPSAVLIASRAGDSGPWRAAVMAVAGIFVVASMLRLARNATSPAPMAGGYYGLTTPGAAGTVMALVFLRPPVVVVLAGVLIASALMCSEIRYPHQDRKTIPWMCAYWLVAAAGLAGVLPIWPAALIWLVIAAVTPLVMIGAQRSLWGRATGDAQSMTDPAGAVSTHLIEL